MIGWEYPPFNSGGLGVACQHIAESLADGGFRIVFTLPQKMEVSSRKIEFYFAESLPLGQTPSTLTYASLGGSVSSSPIKARAVSGFLSCIFKKPVLTQGLVASTVAYAQELLAHFQDSDFDLIYAHDWLTFPAAVALKERCHKPFIAHIHALEFDRAGESSWRHSVISLIEQYGLQAADKIIAVSQYTKNKIIECYGIDPAKITVAHNGISPAVHEANTLYLKEGFLKGKKVVLFVGRLTFQKGIDWFLKAVKEIALLDPNIVFLIVGDGELKAQAVNLAVRFGIAKQVIFTGFLRGKNLENAYRLADVYVLSSVSEPFGISPLEALQHQTPVIVSRNSGVQEVLKGALKVDFWDTHSLAEKILAVLRYQPLKEKLVHDGEQDLAQLSWNKTAAKIAKICREALAL